MTQQIPYGRQSISEEDIQAVVEVLRSDWLTQGPAVEQFEKAVAEYCGAAYAVAVNSATSALHIACLAADLDTGDLLWTSPNTFVASANCALYCGADIDFVDINRHAYTLDAEQLEAKLIRAEMQGRLPKVVIPVHFAGQPCAMDKVAALSARFGFTVIEDASHAIGGKYKDDPIGNCRFSDMTVFSFHPVKIITTGEGGMVLTNRRELYDKLVRLRSHGITRDQQLMIGESHGSWYYQQIELGFNYRLTDLQAALGTSQLRQLDEFVAKRHAIATRYNELLSGLPVLTPWQEPENYSAFHLYVIRLQRERISKSHRSIFESLREQGIGVNVHYIPVHTQPYYEKLGFKPDDFPEAMNYYAEAISLPMYAGLTAKQQNRVVESLKRAIH